MRLHRTHKAAPVKRGVRTPLVSRWQREKMKQDTLFYLPLKTKDVVYTPETIAVDMISWCHPAGVCLDPCKGDGAFFDNFPKDRDWCEIREGKDFFKYTKRVDWIIGNPPYSIFEDWLIHSMELSSDIVYIIPTNKVFQQFAIMELIENFGGIFGMRIYGSGRNVGFPFGFSVGAFHFKRNYTGDTNVSFYRRPNNGLHTTQKGGGQNWSLN